MTSELHVLPATIYGSLQAPSCAGRSCVHNGVLLIAQSHKVVETGLLSPPPNRQWAFLPTLWHHSAAWVKFTLSVPLGSGSETMSRSMVNHRSTLGLLFEARRCSLRVQGLVTLCNRSGCNFRNSNYCPAHNIQAAQRNHFTREQTSAAPCSMKYGEG